MKDFLDIDEQIDRNEKALEFFYSNYQKTQAKLTILIIIYSLIAVYLVQVIKYPFEEFKTNLFLSLFFMLFFGGFLYFLIKSLISTFYLVNPVDVAYMHHPHIFYNDIRDKYEQELGTTDKNTLNAYVKVTYLQELEKAVDKNSNLFENKGEYYFKAFTRGLIALLLYLFCVGFVIFKSDKPNEIIIKNIDCLSETIIKQKCETKNKCHMSDNENSQKESKKEEVKIDPKKVIKTEPKLIKENFSKEVKKDSENKKK